MPGIRRVAVLHDPDDAQPTFWRELRSTAAALRIDLVPLAARTPQELDAALGSLTRLGVDALTTFTDGLVWGHHPRPTSP